MPKVEESTLVVSLDKQGRDISRYVKEWEIDTGYLTSCDGFSFSLYSKDLGLVRGLEMQPVTLSVGGANQLIGRIDASMMGDDGLGVSYEGRDYIADMVECSLDPTFTVKEGFDLFTVITSAAGPVGIDTVVGDDDLPLRNIRTGKSIAGGAGKDFRALTAPDTKPQYGQGIYDYLNRIVARHGATIQPADSRNTVSLTAPNYSQEASYSLRRRVGDRTDANDIVSATCRRDFSSIPTFTMYNGNQTRRGKRTVPVSQLFGVGTGLLAQASAGPIAGVAAQLFTPANVTVDPGFGGTEKYDTANAAAGFAPNAADTILGASHIGRRKPSDGTGDPLALYRLMAIRDEQSRTQEQLERAAVRAVGERLKETLVYEVEVQGHIAATGAVWSVDTIVDVVDDVCGIAEPLWIARRTLRYSKRQGATTRLECWRPGAFLT